MSGEEFAACRRRLERTQQEFAQWLGVSAKAVQAYEQGWRAIPAHAERQVYVLLAGQRKGRLVPCWRVLECPRERRAKCPAWLVSRGENCWSVTGTLCEGRAAGSWARKVDRCRRCRVFRNAVGPLGEDTQTRRATTGKKQVRAV